ncbi:plasmid SOS inhibition protein A, partial [Escherichia coli]|uniref:plasmid SOS inhibition protein A n=1 Tax=Escherichia coli TaxID=562 RepID=UPI002026F790
FPSVRFRGRERSRHKSALVMQKYSRQQAREAEQKARAYQALVAQAEIELAFHSPETVGSWHARWSDRVAEHDLETLFWQWGERFPSLTGMERWQWQDMPFWQVIAEAGMAAREAGHAVREMERCKRLARTVLIFTERSDQLSRATDRVPGLPASPGYAQ